MSIKSCEINSATDNPLVDTAKGSTYHGGNFLGQYIGAVHPKSGEKQVRVYTLL